MRLDLEAIKARAEAATPGRWTTYPVYIPGRGTPAAWHVRVVGTKYGPDLTKANSEFIAHAHARTDVPALVAEVERLRDALNLINRLRSNVIATQSASWSNAMYPLVAILNAAGFELCEATEEEKTEHLHCYGGAGGVPGSPRFDR